MKIRPIFKTIDIFSFIQFLSRQTNYIIKFFLLKVLYLVLQEEIIKRSKIREQVFLCARHEKPVLFLLVGEVGKKLYVCIPISVRNISNNQTGKKKPRN